VAQRTNEIGDSNDLGRKSSRGSTSCCQQRNADTFAGLASNRVLPLGLTRLLGGAICVKPMMRSHSHRSRFCCPGFAPAGVVYPSPPCHARRSNRGLALRGEGACHCCEAYQTGCDRCSERKGRRGANEELRDFLEMAAEEKIKAGMSRKDALRAVRLERRKPRNCKGSRPYSRLGITSGRPGGKTYASLLECSERLLVLALSHPHTSGRYRR